MTPTEKVKFISNWIKNYVDNMPTKAGGATISGLCVLEFFLVLAGRSMKNILPNKGMGLSA